MNSSKQAQQGFKTFILTLVISLIVFSAIYYIVNTDSENSSTGYVSDNSFIESKTEDAESSTLGASSERELTKYPSPEDIKPSERSVFEDLVTDEVTNEPQVLSSTDETVAPAAADTPVQEELIATQDTVEATVPDTGVLSPTLGLLTSMVILSLFSYLMFLGPRRLALSKFEKEFLDDLD